MTMARWSHTQIDPMAGGFVDAGGQRDGDSVPERPALEGTFAPGQRQVGQHRTGNIRVPFAIPLEPRRRMITGSADRFLVGAGEGMNARATTICSAAVSHHGFAFMNRYGRVQKASYKSLSIQTTR
jgi:hypothetical protein